MTLIGKQPKPTTGSTVLLFYNGGARWTQCNNASRFAGASLFRAPRARPSKNHVRHSANANTTNHPG
jgi:hypothetical protein